LSEEMTPAPNVRLDVQSALHPFDDKLDARRKKPSTT